MPIGPPTQQAKEEEETHKQPRLEEESNIEVEEREEAEQGDNINANTDDERAQDILPPDPRIEPFLPIPQKVMMGLFGGVTLVFRTLK